MVHSGVVMMLRRVGGVLLGLWTGRGDARRLGIVAAGATGPQRFWAVVEVIGRGSLDYQIEYGRASHNIDGSFEGKIGEPLTVAPNDHVARLQACCSSRSVVSGTLDKCSFDKFSRELCRGMLNDLGYQNHNPFATTMETSRVED